MTAAALGLLIAMVGAGMILAGIFMLFGWAWTLIAAGLVCLAFAGIIRRGVYRA